MKKRSFAIAVLVLFTLTQMLHCQVKYLPAALLQIVSDDYGVSITTLGMVISACTVVSGFSPVLASILIDKKGSLAVTAYSAALVGLTGLLPCLSRSFPVLLLAYVLCGTGVGFSLCVAPVLVAEYIPPKRQGLILSISFALYNAYCTMSYSMPSYLIGSVSSWKVLLLLWSLLSLGTAAVLLLLDRKAALRKIPDKALPEKTGTRAGSGLIQALRIPSVCVLTGVMTCYIWVNNTYSTFLPNFLEQIRGANLQQSGLITSVSFVMGIVGCLAAGVLSDRYSNWMMLGFPVLILLGGVGLGMAQGFTMLGIFSGIFGFAYQGWIPVAYAVFMSDKNMDSQTLGGAAAVFDGVGHVLTLLIPVAYGLIIQRWGMEYTMLISVLPLVAAMAMLLLCRRWVLKDTQSQ